MSYRVTFEQYHTYEVEAASEDEAFDKAYKEFLSEMRRSVANTWYDSVDIYYDEDEEEEEDRCCGTCYANDMGHDEVDNPCWNCDINYSGWMPKNN